MMKNSVRQIAWLLTGATAITAALIPLMVSAGEKGRKQTTYALGAATIYHILKKRPGEALLFGGATYVAHQRWKDKVNERKQREQARASQAAYNRGYQSAYQRGVSDGYRKGAAYGYKSGYNAARAVSAPRPVVSPTSSSRQSTTVSTTLQARVLEARNI